MDDLISRQAAIDAFEDTTFTKNEIRRRLSELPHVTPTPKKGKWIHDGVKRICPFCKDFIVTGRSIVKYCWNCGAQLKERSEDAVH